MKVQEVLLEGNRRRYILIDDNGLPIIPVVKYLKHLDNIEKSSNTQKTYCYGLKLYFEFLEEIGKDYREVNFNDLSNFVGWLRNPFENNKVIGLKPSGLKKQ